MRVITFETNPKEYHDGLLKYTCEANSVPLKVLGIGEEWVGVKQKIFGYLDYMKGLPEDEIVICCDNRDVIIPSKTEEIVAKFKEMGEDCYFSAEVGSFPVWAIEKHFEYPVGNKYRSQVKVLNSGVCVGYAGVLYDMYEYASKFYEDSFDMYYYLNEKYDISKNDLDKAIDKYPSRLGDSALQCDQLAIQLTYLETDFITLDYDYDLIFTGFVLPDSWVPVGGYRKKYHIDTLWDVDIPKWGSSYRTVYNDYNNTYPLIYHTPGSDYTMSHLRKVVLDNVSGNLSVPVELCIDEVFSTFVDENIDKKFFLCWKMKWAKPLMKFFNVCVEKDKVLVIFTPGTGKQEYSNDLRYIISSGKNENFRIYECCKHGTYPALMNRLNTFKDQKKDSVIIPEDWYRDNKMANRYRDYKESITPKDSQNLEANFSLDNEH